MKLSKVCLGLSVLILTLPAIASNVGFTGASLKGSGCQQGTFSKVLSPDGKQVSILFDELSVEVPFEKDLGLPGVDPIIQTRQLKRCVMTFKASIPQGHRLVKIKFKNDYRGFAFGDEGTNAEIDSRLISWKEKHGRAQRKTDVLYKKKWGTYGFDTDIEEMREASINVNQKCSDSNGEVEFSVKNDIKAEILGGGFDDMSSAVLSLDSNDVSGNFKVKLVTEVCRSGRVIDNSRDRRGRYDRNQRVTRAQLEACRRSGGKWHKRENRCARYVRGRWL